MSKKTKYCRLLEKFVNKSNKDLLEDIYGTNCKLEVRNIEYLLKDKTCLVEVKIFLGERFDDLSLDSDLIVRDMIKEAADAILPETKIITIVSFDI
jgi:hypothetical protein